MPLLLRWGDLQGSRETPLILAYFSGLGLGFMGIEVALMRHLSLFLGHPVYALVIVLVGILLFGGMAATRLRVAC